MLPLDVQLRSRAGLVPSREQAGRAGSPAMSSEDGNPDQGKDADAPKDMPYTAGDSTASSAELVEVTPECLAEDETRLQSYRSYLQKVSVPVAPRSGPASVFRVLRLSVQLLCASARPLQSLQAVTTQNLVARSCRPGSLMRWTRQPWHASEDGQSRRRSSMGHSWCRQTGRFVPDGI